MDEPLQKSLERYDVLDRIAIGGMAEVFLAKAYGAHGFEKTLAIKRILPELARDPEFEARFIAEAKVAVKLSHANVVQVFDFGRIGESLFIAMEFVDGLDLAQLNRKYKDEGRLIPLPAAFHIAIEIIRALDFAHGHNVVHRDVSPSNILISRAGEVKLGDFGIAVAASPHKAGGPGIRKVMGKWRYMSPEQARGDTLDTRSDMFSAASVLFELFTGEKLFPGEEAEDIIKNIETMLIPKASSLRPSLPSRLDEILAGPLSRKPIDRPVRPAIVLRQLIELSYESSIMATALDVAECVASVLPAKRISGSGQQLDDVIRKQLGQAEKSVARRTAVTNNKPPSTATVERGEVSTGMFRKIDMDGISRLEEVADLADNPTAVAAPRARRNSEQQEVMSASSPDSGLHKLLGKRDLDRHTEVGGPPTGAVPKAEPEAIEDSSRSRTASTTADVTTGSRRRRVVSGVAVLLLAAGGIGIGMKLRHGDRGIAVVPVGDDGGLTETKQFIEIDPTPAAATVSLDRKVLGTGRQSAPVVANAKVHLEIALAGYTTIEEDRAVKPGQTLVITPQLTAAPATLDVKTDPSGAQVSLGGQPLGDTPLQKPVPAQSHAELTIGKTGFETQKLKIDLVAGKTLALSRVLKPVTRYGRLQIKCTCFAKVFFKGAVIGNAGSPDAMRLPVGRQHLKLVNPKATWSLDADIEDGKLSSVATTLGGH
ncbi:MAG: serine/threonine protein kinase [Myxococcales bacterium]|nr:serine/threonine protein kinase [Myxococcales bacterium]